MLENVARSFGVDVDALPDRLKTTYLTAIAEKLGVDVSQLPDRLKTTLWGAIAENAGSGGGGGGSAEPEETAELYISMGTGASGIATFVDFCALVTGAEFGKRIVPTITYEVVDEIPLAKDVPEEHKFVMPTADTTEWKFKCFILRSTGEPYVASWGDTGASDSVSIVLAFLGTSLPYIGFASSTEEMTEAGMYTIIQVAEEENPLEVLFNEDATGAVEVNLPNIEKLRKGAFYRCPVEIKKLNMPKLQRIEQEAFKYAILGVEALPDTLVYIGNNAFDNCQLNITELPEGVTRVGEYAFNYATFNKGKMIIPKSIVQFDARAFQNCTSLTEVTFKGRPVVVPSTLFYGCKNITTINVPWAEGEVAQAPWGATGATINYNYTGE